MKIPFCRPSISWREKLAICRQLGTGMISQGDRVEEFEEAFAEFVGSKYAIATSSGTDSLFLSLKYLGIGEGDKVIVPSLTFTASASSIIHAGGTPVFCDVSNETFCLDKYKAAEIKDCKATVMVLLTGNLPDWEPENVIFDSAHLIGRDCYQGGLQTFSFHGTKNMTTGFGGMIATDDEEAYNWIKQAQWHGLTRKKKNLGPDRSARGCEVEFIGWKMNMNNIQAAMGIEQLKRLPWMNDQRRRCVRRYNKHLDLTRYGLHLYPIITKHREDFLSGMMERGIQCSVHFEPLHLMEAYKKYAVGADLKNTEYIGENIVSLPLFPELTNKQIDYVCRQITQ